MSIPCEERERECVMMRVTESQLTGRSWVFGVTFRGTNSGSSRVAVKGSNWEESEPKLRDMGERGD